MPSKKRTKTGKSTEGKKGKSSPKAAVSPKKRPSTPVLVAWGLALSLLGALLYFSHGSRRLPAPPPVAHTTKREAGRKPSPPLARSEGTPIKHEEVSRREAGSKKQEAGKTPSPPLPQPQGAPVGHEVASGKSPLSRHHVSPPFAGSPAPRPQPQPLPAISPNHGRPRLAIVIDDFGPDMAIARQFASLPFPITMSVLPFLAHSDSIAKLVHQKGKEVILHLPMEPLNSRINPGPGALLVSMAPGQIRLSVTAALDTSPYFDGVNNHEGSRLTQDAKAMDIVLSELKERKLFFIDSMTIDKSLGWKEARRLGVPTFRRNVFLDDSLSAAAIRAQIQRAVQIAKSRGAALAIGHPREVTLHALQAAIPYFRKEGVEMVSARDLATR